MNWRSAIFVTLLLFVVVLVAACTSESPAECAGAEITCSADGNELKTCSGGRWTTTACMRERGQLCEKGACVDPWRYGSPQFDTCADEPRATPESLRDKARHYEDVAWRLHVHPDLGWMMDVTLAPGTNETTATHRDVALWESGPNDGLWNALYIGAEAYRYGATRDPEPLARLRVLLASEEKRMRITGVPGIFTRAMRPPNFPGLACPTDLAEYVVDGTKLNDRWVRIDAGGCVEVVDGATMQWTTTKHCGLGEFAGYCFLDNVSQDEYAGHMFALGAVMKLVDDQAIVTSAKNMLRQVGQHLVDHELTFVDWDGRVTEHGSLWPRELFSGFMAAISLSFTKVAAEGSGDASLRDFYERCLTKEGSKCLHHVNAAESSYVDLAQRSSLDIGCLTNWNGLSMHMLSLHDLIWFDHDPARRSVFQTALVHDMWDFAGSKRPLRAQHNSWFDFMYAADKPLGPNTDGPAFDAVKDGVCMMRQFPARKTQVAGGCNGKCPEVCRDRRDGPMSNYPRVVAERCATTFMWWGSPYSTAECTQNDLRVFSPGDYLLSYWMARYYGFITDAQ